ncbi:MAG: hypothetical protein GTO22_07275 [Gemmatimonadales bacterium]|nr:hypothetical protein [Gemmatimonadales bacterium]
MRVRLLAAIAVALSAAACGDEFLDGSIAAITVHGQVRTAAGDPVSDATVRLNVMFGDEGFHTHTTDTTDAAGAYGEVIWNWGTRFVVDLQIVAEPPVGSGLQPDTTLRQDVVLNGDGSPDSLRVDLVLEPSP